MSDDRWTEESIIPLAQRAPAKPPPVPPREPSEEDYPYDSSLTAYDIKQLVGLEKLRGVPCRATAQCIIEGRRATQAPTLESKQIWLPKAGTK